MACLRYAYAKLTQIQFILYLGLGISLTWCLLDMELFLPEFRKVARLEAA
jgi:hypothetical protein